MSKRKEEESTYSLLSSENPIVKRFANDISMKTTTDNEKNLNIASLQSNISENDMQTQEPSAAEIDKAQRRKIKKEKKKDKKIMESVLKITLNYEHLLKKRRNLIKIKDWHQLMHFLFRIPGFSQTSWASIMNLNSVRQIVLVYIPQLSPDLIRFSEGVQCDEMPVLKRFHSIIATEGPSEKTRLQSAQFEILNVPLTADQRKEYRNRQGKYNSYYDMVLTRQQLQENMYPLSFEDIARDLSCGQSEPVTVEQISSGWVTTVKSENISSDNQNKMYALDCEMCITAKGLEITRVTLVDSKKNVVYDELVLPYNQIIDYNTKFSGITEESMLNVQTRLEDVQKALLNFISNDTILIGHSLENDLRYLRFIHHCIIDTAVLFHSIRGPPSKPPLRYLAQRHLDKIIQSGDDGHDSAIDAITCLELVNEKFQKGFAFGLTTKETECIFERFSRFGIDCGVVACKGYDKFLGSWEMVKSRKFVFCKLNDLEAGDNNDRLPSFSSITQDGNEAETIENDPTVIAEKLKRLNTQIEEIINDVPRNSVIIALSGHGDTSRASKLLSARREYMQLIALHGSTQVHDNMKDKVFGPDEMQQLEDEIKKAKMGIGMLMVKE